MKYELTEHTADFGVRVFGNDLPEVFANAAFALFDLIAELETVSGEETRAVQVTGDDLPELMFNWLRELLYLWAGEDLLVKQARISRITEQELTATVSCDRYAPERHTIHEEIKAVTYHQLDVFKTADGWTATVVFDV